MEKTEEPKKEEVVRELLVVSELPQTPFREVSSEGKIYDCVTKEEALTEILKLVRELSKKL